MSSFDRMRGKLLQVAASLALSLSSELLQWQFPAVAAGEKLARLFSSCRQVQLLFARR